MRKRQLMASLAGLALAAGTLLSMGLTAGPASAAAASGCPANQKGLLPDNQVSASFLNVGTTTTYKFTSLADENPAGGVPGLMKYCVYPSPVAQPNPITPQAFGDNGVKWVAGTGSNNFAFVRPGGNLSNIGLKGQDVTMGTAKWTASTLPATQAIVLHVNDSTECASLYGAGSSGTCFVLPKVGPVCTHGDGPSIAVYNALPTDVVNCLNPAIGFEATSTSEFGNQVTLAGTARNLDTLKVDFQSFACESGSWDGNPKACSSGTNDTFNWPITANIYDPGNLTTPIATSIPATYAIPYRPTANPGLCPTEPTKWFNPNGVPGRQCQNSIGTVLTFNFAPGTVLPSPVVWTVAFNTSDYGVTPQRPFFGSCVADARFPTLTDGGCPYDSLNVGDNGNTGGVNNPLSPISGAPYAGSDTQGAAMLNSSWTGAYCPGNQATSGTLRIDQPCWDGLRPLGEIIAH